MDFIKKLFTQSIKNIYHLFQSILANLIYAFPSREIKVIGVTGTNGKTTTCQMIAKILEEAGYKVAMATTINFKIKEKEWINKTKFTTLSSFKVQSFISKAVKEKCDYLVLEVSSHSLDQNRIWGVEFYAGVITNITREHLDYHKTMGEYRKAKIKLFKNVKTAVVNLDMENPEGFLNERMDKACGYSANKIHNKAQFMSFEANNIKLNQSGSEFVLNNQFFKLNLLGKFNIENALAATCMGATEGIKMKIIAQALEKIKVIPGRMEYVPNNKGLDIIVDFALTPDALDKLYEFLAGTKKNTGSRIIAVFGSCGERDRGKRPIMGKIVSGYADMIIVTNDEPYCEDPARIVEEISSGIENKKEGESFWKISDRREAIRKALNLAQKGDIIAVTGMGAEDTMAIGKERIPWNDKKVIQEVLQEI